MVIPAARNKITSNGGNKRCIIGQRGVRDAAAACACVISLLFYYFAQRIAKRMMK